MYLQLHQIQEDNRRSNVNGVKVNPKTLESIVRTHKTLPKLFDRKVTKLNPQQVQGDDSDSDPDDEEAKLGRALQTAVNDNDINLANQLQHNLKVLIAKREGALEERKSDDSTNSFDGGSKRSRRRRQRITNKRRSNKRQSNKRRSKRIRSSKRRKNVKSLKNK